MTPADLASIVADAVSEEFGPGTLTAPVVVERPRQREHGDYATNVALQLAKPLGRPPRDVATALAARIAAHDGVDKVDVAGPGFLNITLADDALGRLARTVVEAGEAYGRSDAGGRRRVNLEFVSANPTGPMHLGHARWAACGDALGRLLTATGYDVTREFYVNDAGAQTDRLAASLLARAKGEDVPENGYHGEYIAETAAKILAEQPDLLDRDDALSVFKERGLAILLGEIQATLKAFGVEFDVWFSERSLHESGEIAKAVERFRAQGRVFEEEGAIWLRTTDFGDDKDRVLVRSDGAPTYFAADCAYYLDKRERGAEKVVIQVGADHHGYTGRMKAMVACYGDDPERDFDLLIGQMVNLVQGGAPVRMSKRAGTFVAFDDLVGAVGNDAARYSLVRQSMDSDLTLDIDLVTRHDPENPVFYVQYAHARIASLLRNAADLGVERGDSYDASLLSHEREGDLLRALGEFPRIVRTAAELDAPHRVARYLEELAGVYHRFYDACRVLPGESGPEPEVTRARLWLCEATRTVLANGLALLGVTAPERM
ncbi:MAG TPA: arginine--tRNA ligase [Frankiaceae bacterium]|jgi:arginyl-tRNA synthetase|nr:arginine--tRNA ligase [Frankiaceae bacterium]